MNTVVQIVDGTITREGGMVVDAHSSVTLVMCGNRKIIVDTSTPRNRQAIVRNLMNNGISPEEIDTVILTHLHMDHTGNNDLFPNAVKLAHVDEIPPGGIEPILDEEEICNGVHILHTPGHTRGSISVLVEAEHRYVIAGDALPTRENYEKWVPPRLNYFPELALKSMKRIVSEAEVIIPGHGKAFSI